MLHRCKPVQRTSGMSGRIAHVRNLTIRARLCCVLVSTAEMKQLDIAEGVGDLSYFVKGAQGR